MEVKKKQAIRLVWFSFGVCMIAESHKHGIYYLFALSSIFKSLSKGLFVKG